MFSGPYILPRVVAMTMLCAMTMGCATPETTESHQVTAVESKNGIQLLLTLKGNRFTQSDEIRVHAEAINIGWQEVKYSTGSIDDPDITLQVRQADSSVWLPLLDGGLQVGRPAVDWRSIAPGQVLTREVVWTKELYGQVAAYAAPDGDYAIRALVHTGLDEKDDLVVEVGFAYTTVSEP